MKKLIFALGILILVGCGEQVALENEIIRLERRIQTAKQVEVLRAKRNLLRAELDKFQTRPEGNVAPVTSQ